MKPRQTSFDPPIDSFNVGDLVKWRNPMNEYESDLILVVKELFHDDECPLIGLSIPDKRSYYSMTSPEHIKKVKE